MSDLFYNQKIIDPCGTYIQSQVNTGINKGIIYRYVSVLTCVNIPESSHYEGRRYCEFENLQYEHKNDLPFRGEEDNHCHTCSGRNLQTLLFLESCWIPANSTILCYELVETKNIILHLSII